MEAKISQVIKQLFDTDIKINLTRPDQKFGDYATNIAMQLAKKVGDNPRSIAEKIATELRKNDDFSEVSIAGPGFINLRIKPSALFEQLNSAWTDNYGENNDGTGKTVVVEYPSPNMAKPYSVGHLRSGNQGWAAKRLMEVNGWKVITDNHLGDYGAPFGTWVTGFLKFSSDQAIADGGVYELGRVYIETKKALKEEAEKGENKLANQVQDWLLKLENGDETALAYSKKFNEISLSHIHDVMKRLGIATDYELGEAFFAPAGKQIVQKLLDENMAEQNDDGSVIVRLDGFDVPILIQKSNGAVLYATTDLATIMYREKNWQPDRVIYSVGAEQQFYFTQVFALAKKLSIDTELIHLWFGTIDQKNEAGKREKMSSRKGVVLMEELLDKAEEKAQALVGERDIDFEDVKRIALGAVKFSDFVADRRTNILFDWETIFALSGMSGPYVQYAAVRVNKILNDNNEVETANIDFSDYDFVSEKMIIMKLLDYPQVVTAAARELEPHKIAGYLYELARDMNRYYETTRVAVAEPTTKAARLHVLSRVSHVFSHGLSILGIEVPSQM